MDSEVVKVDDGEVLFEWGPRTIRSGLTHSPKAMLELVGCLPPARLSALLSPFSLDRRA